MYIISSKQVFCTIFGWCSYSRKKFTLILMWLVPPQVVQHGSPEHLQYSGCCIKPVINSSWEWTYTYRYTHILCFLHSHIFLLFHQGWATIINAFCENTCSLISGFSCGNQMVIHPLLRVDWRPDFSDIQFIFGLYVIVMGKRAFTLTSL